MKPIANNLDAPIEKLKGVSVKIAKPLKKLGLNTARDLLWHIPTRYNDFSQITIISELRPDTVATIRARVESIENERAWRSRMTITTAYVSDGIGRVPAVWFNQPFLVRNIRAGHDIYLSGKIVYENGRLYFQNPAYESAGQKNDTIHTGRLVPVYKETRGITSRWLRYLTHNALPLAERVGDPIPQEIINRQKLAPLGSALKTAHFPKTLAEARAAKRRLAFDELFLIQLALLKTREEIKTIPAPKIKISVEAIKKFVSLLPFSLTDAQRKAAWEILKDTEKGAPMNRLLEGDVGSGKTAVAAIAALNAALSGWQTAVMSPTEVLAHQHFATFSKLLAHENINVVLLTGKTAAAFDTALQSKYHPKKSDALKMIKDGRTAMIVGTHSLIQEKITFRDLGLVVLDEQHRFGVNQRAALTQRSGIMPHFLSMTATPIPRTLALTVYGDLDISILNEMPAQRKKVITKIIAPENRNDAYQFVKEEVRKRRQVFVICPRIEQSEQNEESVNRSELSRLEVKSVKEEYEKLSRHIFPDLNVAMLHGKMKSKEKEKIMRDFKERRSDILVSTSVIEVGIDVPNATVMMIEGAERFGLAQLHQFRGRVGRSEHQSYCLLFSETNSSKTNQRLKALLECDNGFELAEKDLAIRGPGDFVGARQSGLPDLAMASLTDTELIKSAREEARKLLAQDPKLRRFAELKKQLDKFHKKIHLE